MVKRSGRGKPYLRTQQFRQRLWRMRLALVPNQIFVERRSQFGIAANFHLPIVDAKGAEIFREPFVEPSLGRRVVVIEHRRQKRCCGFKDLI